MSTVKSREKQLYKNTGIIAIGTICSKAFQFFLLPLYTNVLSTSEYGVVDVLTTIASLIIPIITLQLSGSVFRFIIDEKDDDNVSKIITSGLFVEAGMCILSAIVILVINAIHPIHYVMWFILFIITSVWSDYIQNTIRGLGNNILFSELSFMMTVISVVLNIVFILALHLQGESILMAASIAYFLAALWAFNKQRLYRYIHWNSFSVEKLKEQLTYSLPLIPNAISWWIANASDRLLINIFLGVSFNGIYAAANKIPALYTTVFNVFNLAWSEAVSRGASDKNQEAFVNEMFERCIRLFGCVCLLIISGMSIFFPILIGSKYSASYNHIWILMLAIFINSLCSIFGGVFTAFKDSKIIGLSTVGGAVINFIVNIATIRSIGLYAASISTLVSYLVILLVRNHYAQKLMKIEWPKKVLIFLFIALVIVSWTYFRGTLIIKLGVFISAILFSLGFNKKLLSILWQGVKAKIRISRN